MQKELGKEETTEVLENLERKKRIKRTASILIVLILLVVVSVFIVFLLIYFQSPEKTIGIGANIESALLNEQRNLVYVKLLGGSLDKNITKIKFIFTDFLGEEHYYETSEGVSEISVPFKRSFWDWLFGKPAFEGKYDYEIKSSDLELENFNDINEVSVSFGYYEEGEIVETPKLDTEKPTTKTTTTGGGNGNGNGRVEEPPVTCTPNCQGRTCGIDPVCGTLDCGDCSDYGPEYFCNASFKCELDPCYDIVCSDYNKTECEINECLNCRWNETDCVENVYYVRADSTGANDGTDWTNAFTELPDVLERGATYFIADGTYGGHTFNDAEQNDSNGNPLYITIKKAIESDHGTDTGWSSTYGDGVALFTTSNNPEVGIIWFQKSYYVFDGQVGGGPGSWKTGHGFKINSSAIPNIGEGYLCVYLISLRDQWPDYTSPNFLEISHVELEHRGVDSGDVDAGIYHVANPADGINTTTKEIFKGKAGPDNVTIRYSYLHDFGWIPIQTSQSSNWLFEYNYVARDTSVPAGLHGNGWQDFGSDNMTIRYNIWEDIEGTSCLVHKHDTISTVSLPPGADQTYWVNENWYIYGNVFFYSPDNPTSRGGTGHGVLGSTAWNDAPSNNILFYNNDIINWPGWKAGVQFDYGTGNKVYNNIWFYTSRYIVDSGKGTGQDYFPRGTPNVEIKGEDIDYDYNKYIDSPLLNTVPAVHDIVDTEHNDPFVDWQNLDFRLKNVTVSGINFSWMDNRDMFGNVRGADGVWDRGAIEYVKPSQIKVEPGTTVEVGEEVYLDGSSVTIPGAELLPNGMIKGSYEWDFGDDYAFKKNSQYYYKNNNQGGTSVTHFYMRPGTYTVTLNVTDINGSNIIETTNITVVGTQPKLPPRASVQPILEMKFEDNLNDTSPNGLTAQWKNGQGSFVRGIEGKAADLTGGSYIEVSDPAGVLAGMSELTISIRAKKNDPNATGYLMDKNGAYNVRLDIDELNRCGARGDITTQSTVTISKWPVSEIFNNEWHHYVITYNGSTVRIFIDGIENVYGSKAPKSQTGIVSSAGGSLFIGKQSGATEVFDGYIDEVKIYNKALTLKEISAGFELWHADFHGRTAQYIYAQIPGEFTKNSGNKIKAEIAGDTGFSKILLNKNNLQPEEKFLLDNSELPAGNYILTVQILGSGNNVLDEIKEKFEKSYNGIPASGIDENNAFRLNGQLFFPVTAWSLPTDEMSTWKSNGYINSLCSQCWYATEDVDSWVNYLSNAGTNNLRAIGPGRFQIAETYPSYVMNQDPDKIVEYVNTTKGSNAVLSWMWMDEPDIRGVYGPSIRSWTYKPHKLDPQHPVVINYGLNKWICGPMEDQTSIITPLIRRSWDWKYNAEWFGGKRTNIVDVISVDWYPVAYQDKDKTDPPFADITERVDGYALGLDRIIEENYNLVPVMTFVETCEIASGTFGPPTPEQLKMLIWINIVHGAKAINWFQYFTTTPPENFAIMQEFVSQITELSPVVLGPEVTRIVIDNANSPGQRVDTMVREYEGDVYVFAVRITELNEPQSGDDITVAFNIENFSGGIAEVFNESRTINVVNGDFTDTFAPNDVHIYRIPSGSRIGTFSPFAKLWNFLKGLLTKETGQAILTGNVAGNGSGTEKTLVGIVVLVLVIGLIVIVLRYAKIKKKRKKR